MKSIKIIERLSNANGAPGFELDVVDNVKQLLDDRYDVKVDAMNNCYIKSRGYDVHKPTLLLDAHSDEVSLMVQAITAKGLLKVVNLGGWDVKNLISQKFRVITDDGVIIKGVVASVPVHFLKGDAKKRVPDIADVLVDVGASNKQEVLDLGIRLGTPLVPDAEFEFQEANDVMIGKAFDNRMGCSLVVDTLNQLSDAHNAQVTAAISTQEEVGLRGARVVGNNVKADIALIFEGTPADDTFTAADEAQSVVGKGVQIRLRDNSMVANPRLVKHVLAIAEASGVPHQLAVRRGGGTNGGAYHLAKQGIPSIVLGVPVRYIHAHNGIARLADYQTAKDLALAIIKAFNANEIEL